MFAANMAILEPGLRTNEVVQYEVSLVRYLENLQLMTIKQKIWSENIVGSNVLKWTARIEDEA